MKRNIVLERVYPYTPAQVWPAIATQQGLSDWLMETDFQPYVGHRFQFRTKASLGFDGVVNCEVIAVEEPRRLAYTWQGGPMKRPTTVTWTLTAVAQGTLLRLEHTGFEGLAGISVGVLLGMGWKRLLRKRLAAALGRMYAREEAQ